MHVLKTPLMIISPCLILLGALCKIQHWPGGQIMLAVGMIGIVAWYFLPERTA